MNIVLDGRVLSDHFPGIGRYLYHLTGALARLAPDDTFMLLHSPDQHNTRYDLRTLTQNTNLTLFPVYHSPFALAQQWALPRKIGTLQPSLFHAAYYIYPYRAPAPRIVTLFDIISHDHPYYLPSLQSRLIFEATTRLALWSARRILVPSQATAEGLGRAYGVSPDKMTLTPLAADAHFRPAAPDAIMQFRERHHLHEDYVLYLGSNKPHKNLVRLVQAWERVVKRRRRRENKVVLVIAGPTDTRHLEARQRVQDAELDGHVRFLGTVEETDLPTLYSGALCFAFPSLAEGFGLPVLEAMACGTPVLASNLASIPEITGKDAALLVSPYDVESMAVNLLRLLAKEDLRAQLREAGLRRAAQFTWQRTAELTLEAYREIAR